MNTSALWPDLAEAEPRVHRMQTKLHQWATALPGRRFDDLYNLVQDPAFLVVAWNRVRRNRGARTAGVDGVAPRAIGTRAARWLAELRDDRKARRYRPSPVRETMIPKANGKVRRLGIPTAADRVVQAALKLVLERIFEADFQPSSYGFRPKRRAQDAIAEIHSRGSPTRNDLWVFEADIAACFDAINHTALMDHRVRERIGDKRGPTGRHARHAARSLCGRIRGSGRRYPSGGTRRPARRRAVFSRRCCPTSPSRFWTRTLPRNGWRSARPGSAPRAFQHDLPPSRPSRTLHNGGSGAARQQGTMGGTCPHARTPR